MDTPITIVEMCAGYGGIGLGLRRIFGEKLRTIAYSEIEASPCELLLARMEEGQLDAAPIWTDLKSFPWQEFHGLVSILVAGYPCQPFSAAGARKGEDDPRHLFPYIREGIRQMRPTICFFENVEGHISLGLEQVLADLEEIGYESSFCLCSAAEVGLPHQRKRVFIMAYDKSQRVEGHWASWLQESYTHARKTLSLCGDKTSGAFPARPNKPQHWWEPPRVLGNPKHDGLHGSEISGSSVEASDYCEEGEELSCESTGASKSNCFEDLSECEELGNTECSGWQGGDVAQPEAEESGTGCEHGGGVSPRPEIEPSFCGDSDGTPDWVGYVNLCKSYSDRIAELKMLGNGVCPLQAERAFLVLLSELGQKLYEQRQSHIES